MASITFQSERAHSIFHSMAEGMAEVQRDDGDAALAAALVRLIEATAWQEGAAYPVTLPLPAGLYDAAEAALENCLDNRESWVEPGDPEAEDSLFEGDVTIAD